MEKYTHRHTHANLYAFCGLVWSMIPNSQNHKINGSFFHSEPKIFIQFSRSVMSNFLRPHELQHARSPCPLPTPRVHPNSCPWSQWCHPAISSSVVPFSFRFHSLPASGSFPMCQLFTSDDQSIGPSASASVLPMNIQGSFPLGLTGLISLQSRGFSRVFSSTTIWNH